MRKNKPVSPSASRFVHLKLVVRLLSFCVFRGPNSPKVSTCLGAVSSSSNSFNQIANRSVKTAEINVPHKQSCHNEITGGSFQTCSHSDPAAKAAAAAATLCLRGPLHPAAMKSCKVKIIKKKGELLR